MMISKTDQRKENARILLLEGKTNQEVATEMGIGLSTVGLYKQKLRAAGVILPEFRFGKPAKVNYGTPIEGWEVPTEESDTATEDSKPIMFSFIIDGVLLSVPTGASINVIKGQITIQTEC